MGHLDTQLMFQEDKIYNINNQTLLPFIDRYQK